MRMAARAADLRDLAACGLGMRRPSIFAMRTAISRAVPWKIVGGANLFPGAPWPAADRPAFRKAEAEQMALFAAADAQRTEKGSD